MDEILELLRELGLSEPVVEYLFGLLSGENDEDAESVERLVDLIEAYPNLARADVRTLEKIRVGKAEPALEAADIGAQIEAQAEREQAKLEEQELQRRSRLGQREADIATQAERERVRTERERPGGTIRFRGKGNLFPGETPDELDERLGREAKERDIPLKRRVPITGDLARDISKAESFGIDTRGIRVVLQARGNPLNQPPEGALQLERGRIKKATREAEFRKLADEARKASLRPRRTASI